MQAHRLELSDDDHEDDMDVSEHQAAEGVSPPAAQEEPAEVSSCTDSWACALREWPMLMRKAKGSLLDVLDNGIRCYK